MPTPIIPDEWVAPLIAGVFLLLGGLVAGLFNLRTNRRTTESSKEPNTTDAWREADRMRRLAHLWEDLFYLIRAAFKGYARRMQDLFGEDPAALSTKERTALDASTPNDTPVPVDDKA